MKDLKVRFLMATVINNMRMTARFLKSNGNGEGKRMGKIMKFMMNAIRGGVESAEFMAIENAHTRLENRIKREVI